MFQVVYVVLASIFHMVLWRRDKVWWYILLSLYWKFTAKSVGERILKIDQHLAKLKQKESGTFFPHTFTVKCFVGLFWWQWEENIMEILKLESGFWLVCSPSWSLRKFSRRAARMRILKIWIPLYVFVRINKMFFVVLYQWVTFLNIHTLTA